jgi:Ca2+-dependent lipid-binding protein
MNTASHEIKRIQCKILYTCSAISTISCEAVFIVLITEQMYNVFHCILFISCEAVFIVLIAEHVYNNNYTHVRQSVQ